MCMKCALEMCNKNTIRKRFILFFLQSFTNIPKHSYKTITTFNYFSLPTLVP